TISELLPVICWTATADGWTDWYNSRWYEFTGQPIAEAIGWGWQAVHHPVDFAEVMTQWPTSIATGQPFEMEFRLRRADGVFCWFLARAEPLKDDRGRVVRWYGTVVDIEAQKQAHERTKRVAETLQDVFLPKTLPVCHDIAFDALYLPAEKDSLVGGDWYDAFELPDGRIMFSIGDVAGHGLEASVMVGRLRQAILTIALRIYAPSDILSELNYILALDKTNTMVTAIVGSIDPKHRKIAYAIAGHPPPMVAREGARTIETLPVGGAPLGISPSQSYETFMLDVGPGTTFALYTDGMIEFTHNVIAGEAKMEAALLLLAGNKTVAHPARTIKDWVFNDAPATDDAALLIIEFTKRDTSKGEIAEHPANTWRFHASDARTAHGYRREIAEYLRELASDESDTEAAELVIGELIANAVRHAPSLVEVSVDWSSDDPIVVVCDHGGGIDRLPDIAPVEPMSENGRGLFLVRSLARGVTIDEHPSGGTVLRVRLNLSRRDP
ncbi:MAG TPA: SpoIIE family protein phosphatase, partial [Candidatus Baltobacteraceae bacterium]|nr:SpoIIE family protein phosphatase [Candidatus Baltobacteraceae bacterium]